MDKMCNECPFNPESSFHSKLPGWIAEIKKSFAEEGIPEDGTVAVPCHMLPNASSPITCVESEMCAGHVQLLKLPRT